MGTSFFIGPFRFQAINCKDGILLIMSLRGSDGSVIIDEWCLKDDGRTDVKTFAQAQAAIKLQQWIQECNSVDD